MLHVDPSLREKLLDACRVHDVGILNDFIGLFDLRPVLYDLYYVSGSGKSAGDLDLQVVKFFGFDKDGDVFASDGNLEFFVWDRSFSAEISADFVYD